MGHLKEFMMDTQGKISDSAASFGKPQLPPAIKPLWKCLLSEFVGDLLLIFLGCGVGLRFSEDEENKPWVLVALCWTFVIATLGQSLHYSCDINPAVTIAKAAAGKRKPLTALMYVVVQCLGCMAGAYLLKILTPDQMVGNLGATTIAPEVSPAQAVIIEAICTGFLVFTCFAADDEERDDVTGSKPLSIGLCVCAMIMMAGPLTAASFNPARTLGPSVVAGSFEHHWVYWVGPIVGGLIGGQFYHHVFTLQRVRPTAVEPQPASV